MADELDPPRKYYGLKPKEFERVNPPVSTPVADPTGRHSPSAPLDVRALAKIAAGSAPLLGHHAAPRRNDVHAILSENLARADAAGLNTLNPLPPRPSRRKRDYWLLLTLVSVAIFGIYGVQMMLCFQVWSLASQLTFSFSNLLHFALSTPQMYAIPVCGIIFFATSLAWLMFGIMDDY